MSEAGWRAFLADAGAEEWAVLHGGPTAVFRTSSLADAAALAQAIAAVPGLDGTNAQINLLADRVTVRLTREVWKIEESHAALADGRQARHHANELYVAAFPSWRQCVVQPQLRTRGGVKVSRRKTANRNQHPSWPAVTPRQPGGEQQRGHDDGPSLRRQFRLLLQQRGACNKCKNP